MPKPEALAPAEAATWAQAIAAGQHRPLPAAAAERLALAWALKSQCQSLWTSEPARMQPCVQALRELAADGGAPAALASWAVGIQALAQGDMPQGLEQLEAAAGALEQLADPLSAAQARLSSIMALSMLGQHERAEALGQQILSVLTLHGDTGAAAKLSLNLGSMKLHQDEYLAAAGYYREAGVLFARIGQMQHSVVADIGLAGALGLQGQFDEAQRMLARAKQRAGAHALPLMLAMAVESSALLSLARGDYASALSGLEDCRHRYEDLQLPQQLATAEKQLADAYLELNLMPEALALYSGALARFAAQGMPQEQAWTWVQQGRAQARLGQMEAAQASLAAAAALFAGQHNSAGPAAVALAKATLALQAGQWDAALSLAADASGHFEAAASVDGPVVAQLLQAQVLYRKGDPGALAQARTLFGQVVRAAQHAGLAQWRARAQAGLGLTLLAEGEPASAHQALTLAVQWLDDLRRTLPGDELRQGLWADLLDPHAALLGLALEQSGQDRASAVLLLQHLDRQHARTLGERLVGTRATLQEPAVMQALRTRLNWLNRRQRRYQEEAQPTPAALVRELGTAERELLELARRDRIARSGAVLDSSPHVGRQDDSVGVDANAPVDELCGALANDEAVLAYGVHADELFACCVRGGSVHVVRRVAAWSAVEQAVQELRFQLESLGAAGPALQAHASVLQRRAQARLRHLRELVWAPVAQALAGTQRVLVVPHGGLASVPFAALPWRADIDDSQIVGDHLELAMAHSVTVAYRGLQCQPMPMAAAAVMVVADSARLPHAAQEARAVADCHAGSRLFLDQAARLDCLAHAPPGQALVHLACHAEFRHENPLFSALHLADGVATAEWVEQLHWPPCTVVLSACETALGSQSLGDEGLGLVRAFLLAGAARVVASLWPVGDAPTAVLMSHLHQRLAAGDRCAQALRHAQAATRALYPHPCHWAGFVTHGGW